MSYPSLPFKLTTCKCYEYSIKISTTIWKDAANNYNYKTVCNTSVFAVQGSSIRWRRFIMCYQSKVCICGAVHHSIYIRENRTCTFSLFLEFFLIMKLLSNHSGFRNWCIDLPFLSVNDFFHIECWRATTSLLC